MFSCASEQYSTAMLVGTVNKNCDDGGVGIVVGWDADDDDIGDEWSDDGNKQSSSLMLFYYLDDDVFHQHQLDQIYVSHYGPPSIPDYGWDGR